MKGQDIFKLAVNKLAETTLKSIHECKKKVSDVDWFIPHQANVRIIDGTAKKIGISMDRVVKTINKHANTSAASIPLALSNHVKNGSIKRKDLLALCAIGGGLSWGSCVIKF